MEYALTREWPVVDRRGPRVCPAETWDGMSEGQLVELTLHGRTEAYGELVRRHQQAVFAVACRLVGEPQDALDLTQDAFVRAHRALGSFDRSRPFAPWIKRIVANLALNWLERRRGAAVPLNDQMGDGGHGSDGRVPPTGESDADPEHVYLAVERQAALRHAILALPPHYRAVIELRHFQDLRYDEIAVALGIPLSDVKSHLFRARQLLRKHLEGTL